MMELPAQLVVCCLDRRQQLLDTSTITRGQQRRRTVSLLVGRAGVQNVCVVTLFKSPWPVYPSLSTLLSSDGGRSNGRNRCSSSLWKRLSTNANASGEAQTIEQLWEEYFADPSKWWDNRVDKSNPRSPDFKHKVTRKALWADGWSNPPWVKAMLKSVTEGKLQPHVGYRTQGSHSTAQANRLPKNNNGTRDSRPTSIREWRQITQVDDAGMHLQNSSTTREVGATLKNHVRHGVTIDSNMYVEVLQRCFKQKDLLLAKQVQDSIMKSGMDQNTFVANNLLRVFIRCGRLQDARQVFDRLVKKNVFSWTIMIDGHAQHDHAKEAIEVFKQMRQEGVQPNEITYLTILKACASPEALKWGKEVHAHIRHGGFESDVRVGTALLKMYAKSGSVDDAQLGFDRMVERNVVTWTVMIGGLAQQGFGHEAFSLFLQMQRAGFVPNALTYLSILSPCANTGALEWVKEVHNHAMRAGLESDLRVGTALVNIYAKSGSIDDARLVFDRMLERDVVTWNVMIGGLAQHGFGHEAFSLFLKMHRCGIVPDAITYMNILSACASAGALDWVQEVHSHALRAGLESDVRVGTALVNMYAKSGSVDDARLLFDRMVKRDVVTWNVMISGLAQHGFGHEALSLFLQMQRAGFVPNAMTFVSILSACASAVGLEWVRDVQSHVLRAGLESDLRVGTALVNMYAKGGSIDDARLVFDRMVERDVVTWNVMIGGLAQHGCGHEALLLFGQMIAEGVTPDEVTFVATLSACSHVGLVEKGRHQFLTMTQDYGIKPTMEHYTCMVDLLGRAGHLEDATLFIRHMPLEPDGATWGALLGACRTHGNVELAELAAKECLKLEPKNAAAYVLLSNIYAAAGKWDQVSSVRTMMQDRGIHKEPGRSWIEVNNEIHRFVVGDTSHPEAKEIYAELNILTDKMKAGGYIPDTRLVLHNIDEEDKELALCSHSEKLAIAYGLMRTAPENPIRIYKNLRVCSDCHTATKFISKVTGREIVARDANRFHHFKDGVCSCGDYW